VSELSCIFFLHQFRLRFFFRVCVNCNKP
jgi:hypothetical protein